MNIIINKKKNNLSFYNILLLSIIFFIICNGYLINTIECAFLQINPSNGQLTSVDIRSYYLPETIHSDYNAWVTFDILNPLTPICTDIIDAQYIPINDIYIIDRWYLSVDDYGVYGGIIISISIIDLEHFVSLAYQYNVWPENDNKNCQLIWHNMLKTFIEPLIERISLDKTFSTLKVMDYGLEIEVLCRTKGLNQDLNYNDYIECDEKTYLSILNMDNQ